MVVDDASYASGPQVCCIAALVALVFGVIGAFPAVLKAGRGLLDARDGWGAWGTLEGSKETKDMSNKIVI